MALAEVLLLSNREQELKNHDLLSLDEAQHHWSLLLIKALEFLGVPAEISLEVLDQVCDKLRRSEELCSQMDHGPHRFARRERRRVREGRGQVLQDTAAFVHVELQQLSSDVLDLVSEGRQQLFVLLR